MIIIMIMIVFKKYKKKYKSDYDLVYVEQKGFEIATQSIIETFMNFISKVG